MRNKIPQLRDVFRKAPINLLCVDETKLDASFPDVQFYIEGYEYPPFMRDRKKYGEAKMILLRGDLIAKRLYAYEATTSKTISLEVRISEKNGV